SWCPGLVGVEALHRLERLERLRAEVLFVNHAILADDEGLDARDAVLNRRSGKREAADHRSLDDVVELPERRRRPLSFQDLEEVAVIRLAGRVALLDRAGDLFADGSAPRAVGVLPRQAVLLARRADDPLRVLVHVV